MFPVHRYYFDTEFIEEGDSIYVISIGIVSDDGREFYAEVTDDQIPWDKAHPWVLENVRPLLHEKEKWLKQDLAYAITSFVAGGLAKPQFWAWFGAYDWVVFCKLFGDMTHLPANFPMYFKDLRSWAEDLGDPQMPDQEGTKHDALEDARWNRKAFYFLREVEKGGKTVGHAASNLVP